MIFDLDYGTITVLAVFIITIFLVYRTVKLVLRAALVAAVSFSFPWIANYINLGLSITPNIETGIQFAILGVSLFIVYEFAHTIFKILKIVTWPIRKVFRRRK